VPENCKTDAPGELEGQLEGLLRQQRELLLSAPVVAGGKFDPQYYSKASRRSTFLAGALTAALLLGALGCGAALPTVHVPSHFGCAALHLLQRSAVDVSVSLADARWGWARFTARRMSIVREALADAVLETQRPDVVKRLIAQVGSGHISATSRLRAVPACRSCCGASALQKAGVTQLMLQGQRTGAVCGRIAPVSQ
jgi:hypothetical protein